MNQPTLAGFTAWIYSFMGITTANLPTNSIYITWAYNFASALVNQQIQTAIPLMYEIAVYNLAGHQLIYMAPDVTSGGSTYLLPNGQTVGYFAYLRNQYKMNTFVPGVVSSASDEGTSTGIEVAEGLKNLTVGQLQLLNTPYGQMYVSIAQSVGTLWGLS